MADQAARVPKILRVLNVEPDGDDFKIWVASEDGKKYSMTLARQGVGSFIDAFEDVNPTKRGQHTVQTLTVQSSRAVARPDGAKALMFQTLEAGTIAFALSDEGIQALLKSLAALRPIKAPSTRQ